MTRGNEYKLAQHHCHYDLKKYNYTNWVIPIWNIVYLIILFLQKLLILLSAGPVQ